MTAYKMIYTDGRKEIVHSMNSVLEHLGELKEVEVMRFPASRIVDYIISIGGLRNGKW